ncbi:MAG: hypothetical protein Q7S40_28950 [Opitutaceae bacterium]|nr:hypothetical protein [Opitutaceae bacterium]
MAKLLRVHLVALGHHEARFHPLSLRFDGQGIPMASVVNLRNGGGKTSLLSLIYAVLLPGKLDFLGKVNGSNRTVDEYFTLGRLGIIALEMESQVGRFVLMLAWVRKDREEQPTLFSFRSAGGGIPFDELPLQEISPAPVTTLGDLERWLKDRHGRAPAQVDLFVAPNFRDWHSHLKKARGVDSHLYRSHLAMNRSEGAVDEEFKFTKTNDFIRRYLEFAIEAPTMGRDGEDPVTANLNEHRQSLTKLPHYQKEIDFIDQMLPPLRELDGHATRRKTADTERSQAMSELGLLAEGLSFLERQYRTKQAEHEREHREKKSTRDGLIAQRDNARRYASGYDRRAKELRISEARVVYDAAKEGAQYAAQQAHLLACAQRWREVRRATVRLKALTEQRDQLQNDLRPELHEVERRALRLNEAYNEAILAAELALADAKDKETDTNFQLGRHRGKAALLKDRHGKIGEELSGVRSRIESANKMREDLREKSILLAREGAAEAEKRLGDEQFRYNNSVATLRREAGEARGRAKVRRAESKRLLDLAAKARAAAEQASADLRRFEDARAACALLETVKQVLEGGEFDPFNPGVIVALQGRERTLRQQELVLGIERAEDRRLIERYDPQHQPLFPPPREIEKLLVWLREQNIRGVMTAYEWLNANLPGEQAEAARSRLRADPATYSGLIANTQADLDAAEAACAQFAVSRPVKITLSAKLLSLNAAESVTVLPERSGLFNARAAVGELGQISENQRQLDAEEEELGRQAGSFAAAATQVESLQRHFSAVWVADRQRAVAENDALVRQHTSAADAEHASAERAEDEAQRGEQEAVTFEQRSSVAGTQLAQVTTYRNNFGNHLESWLHQQAQKSEELTANENEQSELAAVIRRLEADQPTNADRRRRAEMTVFEHQTAKTALKLSAYLPAKPPATEHGDIAAEELPFTTARDTYEQKLHHGPLDLQITAAQQGVTDCENTFNRSARGTRGDEVGDLSETPDLDLQSSISEEDERKARTEESRTAAELQRVEKDKPKPLGVNERADLDPELPSPATSEVADRYREEKISLGKALDEQADALREVVAELESQAREAKANADQYSGMADLVLPGRAENPCEHSDLTGQPDGDRARVKAVKKRFEDAKKLAEELGTKMEAIFDNKIDLLVKHEKWDNFSVDIRDRFRRFTRKDYEQATTQHIHDCEERKAGIDAKMVEIEKLRDTLVDKLYERANDAIRSLEHAARLSRMPEGTGAWSGQPFLKVRIPARGNQAERRVLLGRLMDSWMAPGKKDMSIPRGAALAHDCLLAVMNQREIDIEILKPEGTVPSACNYQPVTKLAAFSGGQRVTAAILLYCVIVRVRSDQGDMLTDCGFLILDNPFGQANHFPLVDLQLNMARVMGVQLIYFTGINDLEALASFPLRLRLRNSARNGANGDQFVRHEPNTVAAVRLGEVNPTNGNAPRS